MIKVKTHEISRVYKISRANSSYKTNKISIQFSIISLILLSSTLIFLSNNVSADDSVIDIINIDVPTSCSLSGTGQTSHNEDIINGTYMNNIGTTTLKAFCNDHNGFAIYATGYTNNTIGEENSNKLVGTTSSGNATIVTGTNTGPVGGNDISNFAMKLTVTGDSGDTTGTNATIIDSAPNIEGGESVSFTNYHTVPNAYVKVAHKNSHTDMNQTTGGATLTTTYAAYISKTQPADMYTGQVKYTLVHPVNETPLQPYITEAGCIRYYKNGGNVEGTMGCQTVSASATGITLLASNYSRDGYGFAGWSDVYDYATNPNANFYGPNERITFTAGQYSGNNNGLSLYAVWIKSVGDLQDSSKVSTVCSGLTQAPTNGTANLSSVSALTDMRDHQTYAIAKLADGKCWMIENLRLEARDTVGQNRFNASITNESLAQGYGVSTTYGNFSGLADAESTNFSDSATANSLYYSGTQSGTASINIGTGGTPNYRFPRYNNWNNQSTSANRPQNPTSNSATNSTTNAGMYSYGNYYTWHAAIADLTFNSTNNNSVTNTSLCPSGWHLPTGGMAYASGNTGGVNVTGDTSTFREFYDLGYKIMGSTTTAYEDTPSGGDSYYSSNTTNANGDTAMKTLRKYPNNFLYSGYFSTSSTNSRGSNGYYWSSTAYNYSYSYYLGLYGSLVYPGTYKFDKFNGYSIRCLASGS